MSHSEFTVDEEVGLGRDSFVILWRFVRELRSMFWLGVFALLFSVVGTAGFQLFVWLSGEYANCIDSSDCAVFASGHSFGVDLYLLTGVALAVVLIRVIGWIVFEVGGQWAAQHLHAKMIHSVGRVRTTFFDQYPSGKVINRLVGDFSTLQFMGPIRIGDTMNALIELFVLAMVVSLSEPWVALLAIPTLIVYFIIQQQIAPMLQRASTIRSIKRGVFIHRETDVIEGARQFLLYGHEQALGNRLKQAMREFAESHVFRFEIEAWGRFWSQAASALYGTVILTVVAYSIRYGAVSAVIGALIITAVLRLGGTFLWLSWAAGMLFESATQARRVFDYVDLVSEEQEEGLVPAQPLALTPTLPKGDLIFNNFSLSYRKDSPLIIDRLDLVIESGSKVGLIGRTGSGKTSILEALFRTVYVQGGDILVGETSLFSLTAERSRELFAVVPQHPYLFEGTIRSNLVRFHGRDDDELRRVLDLAQISLPLDTPIYEGGRNLSFGQRQLVCLARVLLTDRPIVIMDEPTSGVDTITDGIIQQLLHTELAKRTVITIAHRLETLTRVDKIVELSMGRVIRIGSPSELIEDLARQYSSTMRF